MTKSHQSPYLVYMEVFDWTVLLFSINLKTHVLLHFTVQPKMICALSERL